jgi:hypothetical protein
MPEKPEFSIDYASIDAAAKEIAMNVPFDRDIFNGARLPHGTSP